MAARTTQEDGATVEEGLRDTVAVTVPVHTEVTFVPESPPQDSDFYSGLEECLLRFLKRYFALHIGIPLSLRFELISQLKKDHIYSLKTLLTTLRHDASGKYPLVFVQRVSAELDRVEAHGLVQKRKLDIEEEYEKVSKRSKGFTVIHNGYCKEIPGVQMQKKGCNLVGNSRVIDEAALLVRRLQVIAHQLQLQGCSCNGAL